MKLYGSLENRLEENRMFCDKIEVGTGVTEYSYTDRHAYEVVEVKDQKHVTIRELDHELVGEAYSNEWKLISNENNPTINLVKRGNYWYSEKVATIDDVNSEDSGVRLWVALNGFDVEKIREKGYQKKYTKKNVSFGKAEYHYDYEF